MKTTSATAQKPVARTYSGSDYLEMYRVDRTHYQIWRNGTCEDARRSAMLDLEAAQKFYDDAGYQDGPRPE